MQDDNKRIEKLLEENISLSKENNKLLLGIRKGLRIAFWMRVLYFFIATGLFFGAFYIVAPYLKNTAEVYKNFPGLFPNIMDYAPYLKDLRGAFPEENTAQ